MYYNKNYSLSDYLNYEDLNELTEKVTEVYNAVNITVPSEEGITATTTNGNLKLQNVDLSKQNGLSYMLGDTSQDGTPTPTTPIGVNTVTGRQTIAVMGKNLLNSARTNTGDNNWWNSFSTYDEETGTLTRSTTNTSESVIQHRLPLESNQTYTLSLLAKSNGYVKSMDLYCYAVGALGRKSLLNINLTTEFKKYTFTFTTDSDVNYSDGVIRIDNNGTTTSGTEATLTIKDVMLEKSSVATEFEKYNGNNYEINLGKNLIQPISFTKTNSGITFTYNTNGGISVSGTATATAQSMTTTDGAQHLFSLSEGTYTLSGATSQVLLQVLDSSNSELAITNSSTFSRSFTLTETKKVWFRLRVASGTTVDTTIYPQLEKGNVATPYSSYFEPIELCEINNYQDFIRKGTGKNSLNISDISGGTGITNNNNTSITLNGSVSSTSWNLTNSFILKANKTYTLSLTNTYSNASNSTFILRNGSTNVLSVEFRTGVSTLTPTEDITIDTLRIYNAGINYSNYTFSIQLEEGVATQFEPYGYGNKWYIEKQIGKVVLNGSESINLLATLTNVVRFEFANVIEAIKNTQCYCNYNKWYSNQANNSTFNSVDSEAIHIRDNGKGIGFKISNSIVATKTEFQSWLSTHNTIVYYVLEKPTYTEITNTELISQLNSITLKHGLNNIIVSSSNLIGEIAIHYNFVEEHKLIPEDDFDDTMRTFELNDFPYVEDIDKIERNIMYLGFDFFQPLGYIQNRIWKKSLANTYQNFSYEDINRMITDINVLYEHKDDKPTIYNIYSYEIWDGDSSLIWEE